MIALRTSEPTRHALPLTGNRRGPPSAGSPLRGIPMTITTVSIPDGRDDDLLTITEASAILRVPVNTLRWWRHRGDGPRFFKIGRHLVTTIGDLAAWIEE